MPDALFLRAAVAPSTVNTEKRTVDVTWSTGAEVRRTDFDGPYLERLSLDPKAVDLSRLIGGSVLDSHKSSGLTNVLGVVEDAAVDGKSGTATLRFSPRPEADAIFQDVRAGIIRHVSVGYRVDGWTDSREGGRRVRTATRWTPLELSFVPTPADPGATVRERETTMDAQKTAAPEATHPATTDHGDHPDENRAAVNEQIRSLARSVGLDQAFVDKQIDAGSTIEQTRTAALEAIAARGRENIRTEQVRVTRDHDDVLEVRSAMAGALASRMLGIAPEGRAQEFRPWSVIDMAAELMTRRGERTDPRNRHAVVEALFRRSGAHTISDFPLLLEAAANKVLLARYQAAAPTYRMWAAPRNFNDFKPHKFLRIGDFPAFQEIDEEGETKFGTISENRETVTAGEFTSGLKIGRKALVNDDLGALGDFGAMIGNRAAQHENTLAYTLIASDGPTLSDAAKMFTTTRGNKASSASTVDVTNVALGVKAVRGFKTKDGMLLNIAPKYLVVGPAKEVVARQLLATITPAKASDVNPFSGAFELVVDANITGNGWYLMADPAAVPSVVFGYVGGATGPQIRTEVDFDTRALKVAAGLDFAVGAIDWRGAYFNAGA